MRTLAYLLLCLPFSLAFAATAELSKSDSSCPATHLYSETSLLTISRALDSRERDNRFAHCHADRYAREFEVATYDIPVVINDKVISWMDYFQGRGRRHFVRWLSRYNRYAPMISEVLRQHDLPEDLVFLAMIESGFSPFAYSHAKAVGLWQFVRRTGMQYGLQVDWWVDERRDPAKATLAAAQHIRDLFEQFGSWYLVAASYNAGAGKISRAIRRYKTRDFWELSRYRYLKKETRDYVPKLLAAAIIAKNPEAYGFRGIHQEAAVEFDVVSITQFTDLRKVAKAAGCSLKTLKALNPELRRDFTPPQRSTYLLRVPVGKGTLIATDADRFKADVRGQFIRHRVRRGESLWSIASKYGSTTRALASINAIKRPRSIRAGRLLMVPLPRTDRSPSIQRVAYHRYSKGVGEGFVPYRVRRGDTLWAIARRFNVSVAALRRWNQLRSGNKIYAGATLQIKKSS